MTPNLTDKLSFILPSLQSSVSKQIGRKSCLEYNPKFTKHFEECSSTKYKWDIIWTNVLFLLILHLLALCGLWKIITTAKWITAIGWYIHGSIIGMGTTAGAHRLWSQRSYKAKLPLRLYLMLCQSSMGQGSIYKWVRDHRVHHKFSDTNADPHNSRRGFFFSHMGWLMLKKHNDVFEKGTKIDLSDIENAPVVRFQKKHFGLMVFIFCFVIPAHIPWYFWGEDYITSWCVTFFRYALSLHFTWSVNSAAHILGTKPYDRNIQPKENKLVAALTQGEGWHNYHHVFPWDYKAAELGNYRRNLTTAFIHFMVLLGQAYDLRAVSEEMIQKKVKRSGDGTWTINRETKLVESEWNHHQDALWGWNDKDMEGDDKKDIKVFNNFKDD